MNAQTYVPLYHVLLIGIDRYPDGYNSLSGCVNDIDSIENLLLAPPGIGMPPEQIRITRLAAPRPGSLSTSRFQAETLVPTKANLIQALKALSGPTVNPADRVLIYYSGHGDQQLWTGSLVWHEALTPHNDQEIEYLFDIEINALVNSIAARTDDLTIILDCCHSAGSTRGLSGSGQKGAVRTLARKFIEVAPPDLTALGLDAGNVLTRGTGLRLLQSSDPSYLVAAACQSDERAVEGEDSPGQPSHGVFTHSLLNVLDERDTSQRPSLRWADIWPALLAKAASCSQHPWMIGRSERKLFGGSWEKMDAGYQLTKEYDDNYKVGAGRLMGVTECAEIAVYGSEPHLFPDIGSLKDQPVGRLIVTQAGPSTALATPDGPAFTLPDGARGRLVKPGESQRLRVSLEPLDGTLKAYLEESPLLEIVSADASDAEVEVTSQADGGWILANDTERLLATVPKEWTPKLRTGLEHYYRYNTVLRMARTCNDPKISNSLSVQILDCNDEEAIRCMSPQELADPNLPEAPRDQDHVYALPQDNKNFKFCVKVINNSQYDLNATLLNCSAGGLIEYLSDALLRAGAAHVMWLDNDLGRPFKAVLDELPTSVPGISLSNYATDRMIVIGTTRRDIKLDSLKLDKRIQEVVNEPILRDGERAVRGKKVSVAPAELWTATVTPIRIQRC